MVEIVVERSTFALSYDRTKLSKVEVLDFRECIHRGDWYDRGRTLIFRYLNPIAIRGADSTHHHRGRTKNSPVDMSL